jgi:vacuolar-type H+-ATPase subunit F/Vma7
MSLPVYIGDETSAAGYRLAGLVVRTPGAEDDPGIWIREAAAQAPLILLGAGIARRLPAAELDRLLAGITPAVVVVPDVPGGTPPPDLARRMRAQLGVLE